MFMSQSRHYSAEKGWVLHLQILFFLTVQPITRRQILDSSTLTEFADDNFKFDENGRKLSKWVENTVGKGQIARYEQFVLFPQCFQRLVSQGRQKVSLFGNGLRFFSTASSDDKFEYDTNEMNVLDRIKDIVKRTRNC